MSLTHKHNTVNICTQCGILSGVIFCKAFLTCSTGRWANTAATVQTNFFNRNLREKTKHQDWEDAIHCIRVTRKCSHWECKRHVHCIEKVCHQSRDTCLHHGGSPPQGLGGAPSSTLWGIETASIISASRHATSNHVCEYFGDNLVVVLCMTYGGVWPEIAHEIPENLLFQSQRNVPFTERKKWW